jgi:cyclopropane-fatty-acyl-phospholipid synthase
MTKSDTLARTRPSPTGRLTQWRDRQAIRACEALLRDARHGQLRLILPTGQSALLGAARAGAGNNPPAELVLNNTRLFWNSLRRGSIGVAECYMNGDIDSPDMASVLRFFVTNMRQFTSAGRGLFRVRLPDKLRHKARDNTRQGSQRNIAAHYDLGNEFYRRWLDPSMTYSSAVFAGAGPLASQSLEAAQAEKNRRVMAALALQPGQRVLEIGCGWGGFAEAAAVAGADVTGITISRAQQAYALERLARAGLNDRAKINFVDYRDCPGSFDAIASIEMIEAVGEAHWPAYFQTLHERLKPGGTAVIQAITMAPEHFQRYRGKADFIQTYIFPGGMLTSSERMAAQARAAGLSFETVETFAASYAETLRRWRTSFETAWPEISRLGFDERFRRMWLYYLQYCEVGFDEGMINVGHYRMRRANSAST